MTAMTVSLVPIVSSQDSGASISASAVPLVWPRLFRLHCEANCGSFGERVIRSV